MEVAMSASQAVALPSGPAPLAGQRHAPLPGQRHAPLPGPGHARLTRRGRIVAATLAALLVTALSLVAAVAAQAISHPAGGRAPGQRLVQVVVRPGQSLWSVAEHADPDADTRVIVQRIVDLNGLTGDLVQPGQQLWVPGS
jgi:hypothetical protein